MKKTILGSTRRFSGSKFQARPLAKLTSNYFNERLRWFRVERSKPDRSPSQIPRTERAMTSDDDADVVVDDLEKAAFIARESPTSSPTTSRRAEKMRAGCVGGLVVLAILAFASTFATFAAPRVGGGRLVESEAHQQREIMELRTQVEELTRRVDGGGGANASRATRVEEAQARESTDDDDAVVVFPPSPSPPPPFAIVTWAHPPPPPPNDAGTGAVVATNAAATPPTLCSELLRVASNHSAAVRLLSLAQQPSAAALGDAPSPALTRACGGGGGAGGAKKPVVDVFVFGGGEIDTLGAFYLTLVPVRPRRRGERRSLRTFPPGVSLRPGSHAFNPVTPRRLSTPLLTPFNSTPISSLVWNDPQRFVCTNSTTSWTRSWRSGRTSRTRASRRSTRLTAR
jgi:hypothetical protein